MGQRTFFIALIIPAILCIGCAPFSIKMTFEPHDSASQTTAPSRDERSIVLAAVSETATAYGLRKSPDDVDGPNGLRELTGAHSRWAYQILALYERDDKNTAYSRVQIEVRRDKATNEISVYIHDREGDSYEVFTKDLEAALSSALAAALPTRRVVVTRRDHGWGTTRAETGASPTSKFRKILQK